MSRDRRVALLDVNVLLALFDPAHIHHDVAHDWLSDNRDRRWASCPLTEHGFLRTAAALASSREPVSVAELADGLRTFKRNSRHEFWSDEISVIEQAQFELTSVTGHQQITDAYLLGLAVTRRGVLVTFDRRVPLGAVKAATRGHIEVLAPVE